MEFIDLKAQYAALQKEIDESIRGVLAHGQYIMGKEIAELEAQLSAYMGVKHVITCANGTDALKMLYMAYGVGAGDAVFCPDVTFIASIEPACLLGATPVFCDVTEDAFNLCPESLEQQIYAVKSEGKLRPKVVVAVDYLGNPAQYDEIAKVCKRHGMLLIEDAAQSFGGVYHGNRCGSLGDAAIASFFPAKPLGCYGDGGAVMTNDDAIADICESIRVHGKGTSKYDNVRIGLNSRLDTLQAAILLPKLKALQEYEMDARQRIAARYDKAFSPRFQIPFIAEGASSSYAQYALLAKNSRERDMVRDALSKAEIPSMVYYPTPQHALPVFSGLNNYDEAFPNAVSYCERTFSIPMHPYLDEKTQDTIITAVMGQLDE